MTGRTGGKLRYQPIVLMKGNADTTALTMVVTGTTITSESTQSTGGVGTGTLQFGYGGRPFRNVASNATTTIVWERPINKRSPFRDALVRRGGLPLPRSG